MKSSVSVTLIICGTVLILAPIIRNAITTGMLAWVTAWTGKDAKLTGEFPNGYDLACLVAGVAMAIIGAARALKSKSE
jgi:hypothetical protein